MARSLPGAAVWIAALLLAPPLAVAQHKSRHTATGTMAEYDPDTRQLTVSSVSGKAAFRVASDARVWLGTRRLPVAQLKEQVGTQVTVSWAEADGVRTTHTVRLAVEPAGPTRKLP